jgi:hypothetical protein
MLQADGRPPGDGREGIIVDAGRNAEIITQIMINSPQQRSPAGQDEAERASLIVAASVDIARKAAA